MATPKGRSARMALPVNSKERLLDPQAPIVTKTDTKGKITFVNPAFVEISGFTEQELLGQPHNIVRHPDMPRDAFKDLWETVRQDQPWRGFVKNRCKDGGYYWVDAYVTPLTENGVKVGYMSVRSRPTEAQKKAAQSLYDAVNRGEKSLPRTPIRPGRPFAVDLFLACLIPGLISLGTLFPFHGSVAIFTLLSLITSVMGLMWLRSKVNLLMRQSASVMQALGEGNFKYETPESNIREFSELFGRFKGMQVNLRAIVADVISGSNRVRQEADQLNREAQELMKRSRQQSDGITGVAAALEELSVSVSEISEATNKSSQHANKAMEVVGVGANSMRESTRATEQVSEVVMNARKDIEELNNAVSRINYVTQTIKAIAEKTNLLALNAAIEAARAGEAGRGFAVVADEVRKLAEMTRESTTEISQTVDEVREGTERALVTMENAVSEVKNGTGLIKEANSHLSDIKAASKGVAESAKDISAMLAQQSSASTEVANTMERMSVLTESNVVGITHLEGSAKHLALTSSNLRILLKHFEASL